MAPEQRTHFNRQFGPRKSWTSAKHNWKQKKGDEKKGTNTQTESYLQLNVGQKHHFFWLRRANDAGVASAQTSFANPHCPAHLWALAPGDVLVSGPRASAIETWRVDTAHHEEEDILTQNRSRDSLKIICLWVLWLVNMKPFGWNLMNS